MNEEVSRSVVLMSAIEHADHERRILSDEDRQYASRTANELAQWQAAEKGEAISPEIFLEKRAEQVLKKVAERHPGFSRLLGGRYRWTMLGVAMPLIALISGFAIDRIADPHRVDLLSAPLLLILAWNVFTYVALLVWPFIPGLKARVPYGSMLSSLSTGKLSLPRKLPATLTAAATRFGEEWTRLSMPLALARFKRYVHFSAALFALGAVLSLYARGLLSQYRTGWESTFLNAEQLHALLSFIFAPAMLIFPLQGFSIADVRALEGTHSLSPADGARWVHLYAATLFLIVIVPRLALSLLARHKERKLAGHFPIDLTHPYYRKLTGKIGKAETAVLRVLPYSFTIDETRDKNLLMVAQMLLGDNSRVMLRPSTAYGENPQDAMKLLKSDSADAALTVVLFNLNATPENENHGAFLDLLAGTSKGRPLALIDESAYLERIGGPAGDDPRIRERIALWVQFCELHQTVAVVVNLLNPLARAEDIERGLTARSRT
jgi:hypothetical protein